MKKKIAFALTALSALPALAMAADSGFATTLSVDELEYIRQSDDGSVAWSAAAMAGTEFTGLWLVSEGGRANGRMEAHELRTYLSHALSPDWTVTVGWRGDLHPDPTRHWLSLGFEAVGPFAVDTEVLLFVSDDNRSGLRLTLTKELMLTRHWQLVPEIEFALHGHNDEHTGTGSGLSTFAAAARLVYEVTPQFSPYLGLSWGKSYGQTAAYLRDEGEDISGGQVLLGITFWF